MTKRLDNRLALVTGGAAGLGRAIALTFAREGAKVALLDIDEAGMKETAQMLGDAFVSSHRVDLSKESEIQAFAKEFSAKHKTLHVLVNNAGLAYGEIAHSFELSMEAWLRYFAINTVSPLLLAQALRAPLAAAKGVILNQSSMAANAPATAYGVTKAALNSMTFGMAYQFGKDGIRVNAVEPGIMETPANVGQLPPETYTRVKGMQLLDAHGVAEDIANLHLFLASDEARFINCEIISCDAGNRLRGWRY